MTWVLALSGSAAEGLLELRTRLVRPLVDGGWTVAVTLTPTAATWLADAGETDELERLTGLPVRSTPRLPTQPRPHPVPDVVALVPASANSVAKLALGLGDNQALTPVCEAIGTRGLPVIVVPAVNAAHTRHPAWPAHLATLRSAGVTVLLEPAHAPGHHRNQPPESPVAVGGGSMSIPWERVVGAVEAAKSGGG